MKNIFRVRTPQAVDVVDNDGSEDLEYYMAESVEEAPIEIEQPVVEQSPELAAPEEAFEDAEASVEVMAEELPSSLEPALPPAVQTELSAPRPEFASADNGRSWLSQYMVPEMEAIQTEILELSQFIREMEQRKADLEKKVSERGALRNALLGGRGEALKQAVKHVFDELGVSIQLESEGNPSVTMEFKGLDFIGEIVACEGPITLNHIRQLNHRVEDFIGAHARQPKGLLIANPFVNLQLAERFENGDTAFPEELRLLAEERYKFGIVTAPQVFVAYCKFKEGQLDIGEFMSELFETVWIYGNHRDFDRFKVTPVV